MNIPQEHNVHSLHIPRTSWLSTRKLVLDQEILETSGTNNKKQNTALFCQEEQHNMYENYTLENCRNYHVA